MKKDHPISKVQWVPIAKVHANNWNPNSVAPRELQLLYTSIKEDGITQPVVVIEDGDGYAIVDGFHRFTVISSYPDIRESTRGMIPVVILSADRADLMASTVRHNRARGKHSVAGMSNLVFSMLSEGVADEDICNKLGLEAEELARLKFTTGFAKLYADAEYSKPTVTQRQLDYRAEWYREHPDEPPTPPHI